MCEQGDGGGELQEERAEAADGVRMAGGEVIDERRLQAPAARRPAAIEGERDDKDGKEGGEDEAGFCQRAQFAVLPGEQGDAAVPQGEGER